MDIKPLKKSLEIVLKAIELLEHGSHDEALLCLTRAGNIYPQMSLPHRIKGDIYNMSGLASEAYNEFHIVRALAELEALEMTLSAALILENFAPDKAYREYKNVLSRENITPGIKEQVVVRMKPYEKQAEEHAEKILGDAARWFNMHISALREHGFSLEGKAVLEIGASIIPTTCLLYIACGARTITIDKFRSPDSTSILGPEFQLLCYQFIMEKMHDGLISPELSNLYHRLEPGDIVEGHDEGIRFVTPDLEFHFGVDSADIPFPDGSFDLISSRATLEHVGDPEGNPMDTVREIARLLRPGGWSAHTIGLQDHRDIRNRPYDFLQFSQKEWKDFECEQNARANRWRSSHWLSAFRDAGLIEVHKLRNYRAPYPPLTDELIASFHPDFINLDREDLETLDFFILHRKPS